MQHPTGHGERLLPPERAVLDTIPAGIAHEDLGPDHRRPREIIEVKILTPHESGQDEVSLGNYRRSSSATDDLERPARTISGGYRFIWRSQTRRPRRHRVARLARRTRVDLTNPLPSGEVTRLGLVHEDVVTQLDALVADVDTWTSDELLTAA